MDEPLKKVFNLEVERQCTFALIASRDLQAALERNDLDRFWYSVQALLVAVGNLSKLLWPAGKSEERGRHLRESLAVKDDSVLAPRVFRNHFEHFDERLEKWWTSSQHKNFADSNIGPPGSIQGFDVGDFLRNFDNQNFAVTFRGDNYLLPPIIGAIKELHERAAAFGR